MIKKELKRKNIIKGELNFSWNFLGGVLLADIKFEIVKKIGVLSTSGRGWSKELNLVSWNGRDPKFDLREWSPDGITMGKGITLTMEELVALKDLIDKHLDES